MLRYVKAPLLLTSVFPLIWAWYDSGYRRPILFFDAFIFIISAQLLMNLEMDRHDLQRGMKPADCGSFIVTGPCEYMCGDMEALRYIAIALIIITSAYVLLYTKSLTLLLIGIAAVAFMAAYLLKPVELYRRGLGEISTFMDFGPLLLYGSLVAFGGGWGVLQALASIAFGLIASLLRFRHHLKEETGFRRRHAMAITIALIVPTLFFISVNSVVLALLLLPATVGYLLALNGQDEDEASLVYYVAIASSLFLI